MDPYTDACYGHTAIRPDADHDDAVIDVYLDTYAHLRAEFDAKLDPNGDIYALQRHLRANNSALAGAISVQHAAGAAADPIGNLDTFHDIDAIAYLDSIVGIDAIANMDIIVIGKRQHNRRTIIADDKLQLLKDTVEYLLWMQ